MHRGLTIRLKEKSSLCMECSGSSKDMHYKVHDQYEVKHKRLNMYVCKDSWIHVMKHVFINIIIFIGAVACIQLHRPL